jgi:N-acetylglutamate synthase
MSKSAPNSESAFVFRPMTEDYLAQACALWTRSDGVELAEGDSLEELGSYLRRNPAASQVALLNNAVVGALLAGHDGRRGLIYHLAVSSTHRGKGLGRELVNRALGVLRQQGIRRVLILVARDNEAGRAFWRSGGWEALEFAEPMGIDL